MLKIVDYGVGNLGSLLNMCERSGMRVGVAETPADVRCASGLILPGVGSFDNGIARLIRSNLVDSLNEVVLVKQRPILGICLGMQMMTETSDEGISPGLAWIPGHVRKFPASPDRRVPHIGWNVARTAKSNVLISEEESRFYFVHSYYVECFDRSDVCLQTDYGFVFDSGFQRENIFGVQFHPEKSHNFGRSLLQRFYGLL